MVIELLFVFTSAKPALNDLIEVQQWEGFGNRSVANSIALHSSAECDGFANLLLNDHLFVKAARRKNPENEDFVKVVLDRWYRSVDGSAVPCRWNDLIECMKCAGLDGLMIKTIEDNFCGLL